MLVLGVESASDQCGCALAAEGGVIAEARLALPRRHAEALAPQMRFVCEQAGLALSDVDVVAVDHGPGLYTGLRAGLATAKAAAGALGVPLVPVGSLEALAFGARPRPGDTVLSVLDARRGEVFWAWYCCVGAGGATAAVGAGDGAEIGARGAADAVRAEVGAGARTAADSGDAPDSDAAADSDAAVGGLVPLSAPQVGTPAALAAELAALLALPPPVASSSAERRPPEASLPASVGLPAVPSLPGDAVAAISSLSGGEATGGILVVGDGALRYAEVLAASPRVVIAGRELRFPSAGAVALLGREWALAGGVMSPEELEPLYLRSPDARPPQ